MPMLLSDSESSSDEDDAKRLNINKKFAAKFEEKKRFLELQRSKKILEDADDESYEDSEDEESEDDGAYALSTNLDLQITKTITSLKKRDPIIYDRNKTWFEQDDAGEEEEGDNNVADNQNVKKKVFKDVIRNQLLKHGADVEVDDTLVTNSHKSELKKKTLLYDREQAEIREEFLKSVNNDDDDEVDDQEDILQVKKKTKAELAAEELELQQALLEMKDLYTKNPVVSQDDSSGNNEDLNKDEFLMDYILNQKWREEEEEEDEANNAIQENQTKKDTENYSEEEAELEEVDKFESKYNFRFEELESGEGLGGSSGGSGVLVQGHSRQIPDSLRRKDDSRKRQRELYKENKEKEKRQKEAELRRLKNLKRQELQERLKKISEIGGLENLMLNESTLDEEWDPESHERQMAEQFGDNYYSTNDSYFQKEMNEDEWREQDDLFNSQEWNQYDNDGGDGEGDGDGGDDNNNYPQDDENHNTTTTTTTTTSQKKLLAQQHQQMEEELYQLDYEDIVAGIPCRFKYRSVPPEDYGLTTDDILLADDTELNQFLSLKKISAYHRYNNNDGGSGGGIKEKTAKELSKKRKRLRALLKERREAAEKEENEPKKEGDKTRDHSTVNSTTITTVIPSGSSKKDNEVKTGSTVNIENNNNNKKKRRRNKKSSTVEKVAATSSLPNNNGAITTAIPTDAITKGSVLDPQNQKVKNDLDLNMSKSLVLREDEKPKKKKLKQQNNEDVLIRKETKKRRMQLYI